ncbi:hypothetical protein MTO96_043112 [Rhipicephalus appendiculatus]
MHSGLEDEDDTTTRFVHDRTPSPRSTEAVSDSEDEPTWDSASLDMANGYHNGAEISGTTCRICHEGDQKAQARVSLQLLWHHGLRACVVPRALA